jgi:hypothetical protein
MPIVLAIIGVVAIIALAMKTSTAGDNATIDTTVPEADPAQVTDAVSEATPSNDSGEPDTAINSGQPVNIVPTDSDTWPGGDSIWEVARAIAHQEGYGVSMANAPTRNNNPGDISDGFSQFGGETLDSKITHFPDPATGWNWLYNKLKNVHDGRSHVFSNDMTWAEFGAKYASDPNWATGMLRHLGHGVSTSDRVGDYWNA